MPACPTHSPIMGFPAAAASAYFAGQYITRFVSSMNMQPTHLPAFGVFAVAARHQNFAHAAEELGLTASAVSHHVRTLESILGVRLFERHARGAYLTTQGRMLGDTVGAALSEIEAMAMSLKSAPRNANRLRVATLHSLNYCWILPRLKRFTEANPRVHVTFETGLTLTQFDSSGPDLAIRHGDGYWPGLTANHLMDEELFPAAAPGFAKIQDFRDIAKLPLVTDLAFQGWAEWFRSIGLRGVRLPHMHTFNDSTDALRAATIGLGAILARSRLVEPYLRSGELVRLPGASLKARFGYYAVHPAHRRLSQVATAFIQWLRQEAARDVQTGRAGPL
jgi:LysR family glycine cleavage system transcriptional activator